jgi:hypothetical protein
MSSFQVESEIVKLVDIRSIEDLAIEKYQECPKFVTYGTHANRTDDSSFHCVLYTPLAGPVQPGSPSFHQRNFTVPRQELVLLHDKKYGQFTLLAVSDPDTSVMYWLISSLDRVGFLIRYDDLPEDLLSKEKAIS